MSGTNTAVAGEAQALAPFAAIYSIAELVYLVRNLKLAQTFLLDTFFPNIIESDVPEVAIDVDVGKRRLAPFCSPLVEGKFVESRQFQTNLFRPAYIKDKRVPDLMAPVRRMIGERLLGGVSPAERLEANLAREVADQVDMIQRRLEWMAAQALTTGEVTIIGDGYPNPIVVNFQRAAALTVALTGAAQWGQAGIYPSDYVTSWSTTIMQYSGAAPTDILFTTSTWNAFKSDIKVLNAIWMERGGASEIDLGSRVQTGAVLMGRWGQFRLWLYNDWFVDPVTDIEQPMIPDGTVVLTSPALEGVRAFGAIMDPSFNYGALAYAPKMWINQDPANINLMMQSSPIVIPSRVNASFAATVMAPGSGIGPTI